jgi:hypothetical protein
LYDDIDWHKEGFYRWNMRRHKRLHMPGLEIRKLLFDLRLVWFDYVVLRYWLQQCVWNLYRRCVFVQAGLVQHCSGTRRVSFLRKQGFHHRSLR